MSDKMYVVQVEAYFGQNVDMVDAKKALHPIEEIFNHNIKVSGPSGSLECKEVVFLDNLEDFDPEEMVKAFKEFKAKNLAKIAGLYIWEMDVDDADYNVHW